MDTHTHTHTHTKVILIGREMSTNRFSIGGNSSKTADRGLLFSISCQEGFTRRVLMNCQKMDLIESL